MEKIKREYDIVLRNARIVQDRISSLEEVSVELCISNDANYMSPVIFITIIDRREGTPEGSIVTSQMLAWYDDIEYKKRCLISLANSVNIKADDLVWE